jgi:hypothetical protein
LQLAVTLLEPWYDVDDAAALRRLESDLAFGPAGDDAGDGRGDDGARVAIYGAPHTRAALARISAPRHRTPTTDSTLREAP